MTRRIALAMLILTVLLAGCLPGGGGDPQPADVTATYGAEQFRAQLTAQAQP
ncbi:MAG: hypothetical protein ACKOC5_12040 [Chloroflexota bacterium]